MILRVEYRRTFPNHAIRNKIPNKRICLLGTMGEKCLNLVNLLVAGITVRGPGMPWPAREKATFHLPQPHTANNTVPSQQIKQLRR